MTKNVILSLTMALFAAFPLKAEEQVLNGAQARQILPEAETIRLNDFSNIPDFVAFQSGQEIDLSQIDQYLRQYYFKGQNEVAYRELSRETDQMGDTHIRYLQTYKGRDVEFAQFILHVRNNKVWAINGKLFDRLNISTTPQLNERVALEEALQNMGALRYKWEMPAEEALLQYESGDADATYYPKGELVYIAPNAKMNQAGLRLAYRFNIYADEPLMREEIYVDAENGTILFNHNKIHTVNTHGTAVTGYSGTQTISVDSLSPNNFRLRETTRGNGIETWDLNTGTNYGAAVDFTDTDNFWNNTTNLDQYATDAHWGAQITYDYFYQNFGRNSINNAGFTLRSYVHYSSNFVNAFWDGQRMTYGDGNNAPLTALDIAGHEIAHGLTNFTANLIYANESGALNESFSDIFGSAIEFYGRSSRANWTIGEDIGFTLRSMSNPNQYGDPDTYDGSNWIDQNCTPTRQNDQCGVHTNSGVQNFWFYLMTVGGSGINDLGDPYNVPAVNLDTAGAIAFRNLTVYLTPSSNHADARFYAIRSAIDLYGPCTRPVEATTNAWHAVGVGNPYVPGVQADFVASDTASCAPPFRVQFLNNSNNGINYSWDFGDGNTSVAANPLHTYTAYGQFDVTLITDGGACGSDTTVFTSYIDVDSTFLCAVTLNNGTNATQTDCLGKLYDSGGSSSNYADNEDGTITIAPPGAARIKLDFRSFDVEAGSSGCNFDYLEIYDGATTNDPVLGTYCNNQAPPDSLFSTRGEITLRFHSDGGVTNAGFEIDWECLFPTAAVAADFSVGSDTTCTGQVQFRDNSLNAPSSWLWDFGDGNTSTVRDPQHIYTQNGSYNVSLTASNSFGGNTITKNAVVYVDRPTAPATTSATVCRNQQLSLTATGAGDLNWYSASTGGNPIFTGSNLVLDSITASTVYYVEDYIEAPIVQGGMTVSGTGGNFFNGDQYLIFDVYETMELVHVIVNSAASGNRTIELRDANGTVLQTRSLFIPNGMIQLSVGFIIPPGTDYQLGFPQGSQPNLFRNNSGVSYPYNLGNLASITRSSAGSNPVGFYYYFYNWEVKALDCISARTPAVATLDTTCIVTSINEVAFADRLSIYPNPMKEQLNLSLNLAKAENLQIDLLDIRGKVVRRLHAATVGVGATQLNYDVSSIDPGIYVVRFSGEAETVNQKIVITR